FEKEIIDGLKVLHRPISSAMVSERTRLSAAVLDFLNITAPRLGPKFEPLVPLFVPSILRLSSRTNKVYVSRAEKTLAMIITYCPLPAIVPQLLIACKESKVVTGRIAGAEGVLRALNKWDWTQNPMKAKIGDIEDMLRLTGKDKDPTVRQLSRKIFDAYKALFPDRLDE
ncbi:hypothetical protein M422DRAFT_192044, partial [Sphaerobolus stellatus SS14]